MVLNRLSLGMNFEIFNYYDYNSRVIVVEKIIGGMWEVVKIF